jgi:hypothetical protein
MRSAFKTCFILYIAVALLGVRLLGRMGVVDLGMLVHVPLLVGLLLLLIAFLQTQDVTNHQPDRRDVP